MRGSNSNNAAAASNNSSNAADAPYPAYANANTIGTVSPVTGEILGSEMNRVRLIAMGYRPEVTFRYTFTTSQPDEEAYFNEYLHAK